MRILNVTPAYEPFLEKGGPAVKVGAIAENLARHGSQVTVLTPSHDHSRAIGTKIIRGVEVVYLPTLIRYRALTVNPGALNFCRKRLREFEFVHIYGLYDFLGPVVASFCRSRRIPYVVEPLGMIRQIDRSFLLKRIWHALFGASLLRGAVRLIATSQQEQREMLEDQFPRDRIFLRYNGLDLREYASLPTRGTFRVQHGIPAGAPVILFLGRLIPRKGIDLLIPAFARAAPASGWLVVAGPEGEPGYLRVLRQTAECHKVSQRVLFVGPLFGESKKAALVDSDIFALPSEYENFANSVAEAIACGMPVVVTDRCGISEFVQGRVGLVIPRDVGALAEALNRLLTDAPLYQSFKSNCAEVTAKLDWDNILESMMNLYEQLRVKSNGFH
jgi:glycosyltransferase involved in cell wall biosynthesis